MISRVGNVNIGMRVCPMNATFNCGSFCRRIINNQINDNVIYDSSCVSHMTDQEYSLT